MIKALVGVDSNVLTYLIQASTGRYDPSTDPEPGLAPERVAAFRVFLYAQCLYIVPTVSKEVEAIRSNPGVRDWHLRFRDVLLGEVLGLDDSRVQERAEDLSKYHRDGRNFLNDCRIVAEAELGALHVLLTFDRRLRKNLDQQTGALRLRQPSEYWTELDIPQGTPPKWAPPSSNPLSKASWWRW